MVYRLAGIVFWGSLMETIPDEPRQGTWGPADPKRVGRWVVLQRDWRKSGTAFVHRVFAADDPERTPRVLKILKPWQASFERKSGTTERHRARFILEATALRALGATGTPRIVPVLDSGLDETVPHPWYVMPEYLGGSLDEHPEIRGDVGRVLKIVGQVAETLTSMHESEPPYTHRDVHIGKHLPSVRWIAGPRRFRACSRRGAGPRARVASDRPLWTEQVAAAGTRAIERGQS